MPKSEGTLRSAGTSYSKVAVMPPRTRMNAVRALRRLNSFSGAMNWL